MSVVVAGAVGAAGSIASGIIGGGAARREELLRELKGRLENYQKN